MQVIDIAPVYYAVDQGTGVALIRGEDKPPRGALVDFLQGTGMIKPGAVVPVCWQQLWDYRNGQEEVPALFRWPQFTAWIGAWPGELATFQDQWRKLFGLPHDPLADACVLVWEERRN